ncbi:hypothetical protein JW823_05545 [bacterium]|nr:hypothetical protein [candidate division CSSED10-310 bacterium]
MAMNHLGIKVRLWLVLPALALLAVLLLAGCSIACSNDPRPSSNKTMIHFSSLI